MEATVQASNRFVIKPMRLVRNDLDVLNGQIKTYLICKFHCFIERRAAEKLFCQS